jgi:anaerobic selenocysteine-containing dehydrogenase
VLAGLAREDLFTVVFDQVMTDTALYADVVLPATTFLEHYEFVKGYGPLSLQLGKPAIDRVGDSRSNSDVFADLLRRLELDRPEDPQDELETMLQILDRLPEPHRQQLREQGVAIPPYDGRPVQFVDVHPKTTDGKVHLFPEAFDREAPMGLYTFQPDPATLEFPLALISPASERTVSSTLGELPRPDVRLEMNPEDAEARGIDDQDEVRVYNAQGEMRVPVKLTSLIKRGTVSFPKGVWRRNVVNGWTSNVLVPDSLTDLAGGACFNDTRVEVNKTNEGQRLH